MASQPGTQFLYTIYFDHVSKYSHVLTVFCFTGRNTLHMYLNKPGKIFILIIYVSNNPALLPKNRYYYQSKEFAIFIYL